MTTKSNLTLLKEPHLFMLGHKSIVKKTDTLRQ